MKKKQIIIILISIFSSFADAKNAPKNTFRFDDKINPLSDNTVINSQIRVLQEKIENLKSSMPENIFIKKIQEFRINFIESKMEKLSKEEPEDNN